jgi:hypothetical protein
MDVLVMAMRMLSAEYELKWAHRWEAHLDEPKWLSKAMVNWTWSKRSGSSTRRWWCWWIGGEAGSSMAARFRRSWWSWMVQHGTKLFVN